MAKQKSGLQKEISSIFNDETDLLNDAPQQEPPAPVAPTVSAVQPPREQVLPSASKPAKPLAEKPGAMDSRQKKMMGLVAVLAVAFGVLVFRAVLPSLAGPQKSEAVAMAPVIETVPVPNAEVKIDWQLPEPFTGLDRDPMLAVNVAAMDENGRLAKKIPWPTLTMTAIMYSKDNSSAVVNGQFVHQGDIVDGATVVKIERKVVTFEIQNEQWRQSVLSGPLDQVEP